MQLYHMSVLAASAVCALMMRSCSFHADSTAEMAITRAHLADVRCRAQVSKPQPVSNVWKQLEKRLSYGEDEVTRDPPGPAADALSWREVFVQCYYFCQCRIGNKKLPFVKTLIFAKIF